jgi:hypothetical protein
MNKIVRNLLPQDTRAVEFPCAVGLILTGFALIVGLVTNEDLLNLHPMEFWAVFCVLIGSLQLYALLEFPDAEPLRTAIAWVSGSFWLWVSFSQGISIEAIATFALAFSNIVAFLINTVILSEKWK